MTAQDSRVEKLDAYYRISEPSNTLHPAFDAITDVESAGLLVLYPNSDELVLAVHRAICEDSYDDCIEWHGKCVKAVAAIAAPGGELS